jgi:hypothetical protein
MEPPYREFPSRDRVANDQHFDACRHEDRAMVTIRRKRKYADIEWDAITTTRDKHLRDDAGNARRRVMYGTFCKIAQGAAPKAVFFGSAFVGSIKNLPVELARKIAVEFHDILELKQLPSGVADLR